ncbi:hypothetical protein B4U79_18348 [Dinothrombium tinctorium]|uniref:TIL domain-containing protein n=1 Tax=Dinothrombium tinctorium TaxID=1965070 RepID=A0A3S3NYD4_9ACAR|nr:hypothetical protein B4U79_18686 [Dinothrombium tinctorium]RWS01097.1 hypothetical protein B4U79_18600 [Dinothrombium tinctorium]RWS04852.1 hypothetical protein B4U79_18348 [Dinothrombium tinctorium]
MKLFLVFAIVFVVQLATVFSAGPQTTARPPQCTRPNEVYSTSASPCNACPWVKNPSRACPRQAIAGCACKPGFVRRTESLQSECVPRSSC